MSRARVTIDDIRAAGHCVSGAREWLTSHGFVWRDFLKHGATEADLLATGDGLAAQVIERKRAREAARG